MRIFLISVVLGLCLVSNVYADVPAVAFYVVKTDELKGLLAEAGKLEAVDLLSLEAVNLAKGYFAGDCNLYLKTEDYQYKFKVRQTDAGLIFSLRMFSQKTKESVFSSSGKIKVKEELSVKEAWQEEEYVVLFRQENLSQ